MSDINKVDTDWVLTQLAAVRARQGAGDAVLALLEVWGSLDLSPELATEAVDIFSAVALGHSLVPENKDEVWVPAQAGQLQVGQTVRVKNSAFTGADHKLNGRRGTIVAIRTGRIVMRSSDNVEPLLDGVHFRAEQLELKIS